jgi:hypothetical protein
MTILRDLKRRKSRSAEMSSVTLCSKRRLVINRQRVLSSVHQVNQFIAFQQVSSQIFFDFPTVKLKAELTARTTVEDWRKRSVTTSPSVRPSPTAFYLICRNNASSILIVIRPIDDVSYAFRLSERQRGLLLPLFTSVRRGPFLIFSSLSKHCQSISTT